MKTLFPIIAYFLMGVFEVLGDILAKKWALGQGATFLLITMGLYIMSGLLFAVSLKFQELATASIIFAAINSLVIIAAGTLIFDEKFSLLKGVATLLLIGAFTVQIMDSMQS